MTVFSRQQKRHWCIEQSFGLCGRGRGWDDSGEWHWNMYNIIYEASRQSRFDARYWMLGARAVGRPRGMVWGGRREEGSGWGTHVYLWWIHFDHDKFHTLTTLFFFFLYDIIHVLMPFSQIIPPSLSHRVQKTVLYICVSFAVSCRVIVTIFLNSIYMH